MCLALVALSMAVASYLVLDFHHSGALAVLILYLTKFPKYRNEKRNISYLSGASCSYLFFIVSQKWAKGMAK